MFKVYVLVQLAFVSARAIYFHDCGSEYELTTVTIEGCDESPCMVTAGESMRVSFEFYPHFVSQILDQDAVININLYNLRPEVNPASCGIRDCAAMTTYTRNTISSVMTVPDNLVLNQRGFLIWRILNEQGVQVLCSRVTVQTRSRLQKLMSMYLKRAPTSINDSSNRQLK